MYFFSGSGGTHTFELTRQFAKNRDFTLHELTDQGRVRTAGVRAEDGKVTLTGERNRPYVLVPKGGKAPHGDPRYGEFTELADPGFHGGDLRDWNPRGDVSLTRTGNGDNLVRLGPAASGISQRVSGLTPGRRYTLAADVEIGPGERRDTTLRVRGARTGAARTFDVTPARNTIAADEKRDTYAQRAAVSFTAPPGGSVTVELGAAVGEAPVVLDDVRVMADTTSPLPRAEKGTVVAHDDFEGNQPGWGPFVKGDAGGVTDPRTSISDLHEPYSQKEWKNTYSPYDSGTLKGKAVDDVLAGRHSLKSHAENTGLVYRTVPAAVPFEEGTPLRRLVHVPDQHRRPVGLGDRRRPRRERESRPPGDPPRGPGTRPGHPDPLPRVRRGVRGHLGRTAQARQRRRLGPGPRRLHRDRPGRGPGGRRLRERHRPARHRTEPGCARHVRHGLHQQRDDRRRRRRRTPARTARGLEDGGRREGRQPPRDREAG